MRFIKYQWFLLMFLTLAACSNQEVGNKAETSSPLSLWNEGEVKSAIIEFIENVSNESSPGFVPVEKRIATFDNDGTLWVEKPLYIPVELEMAYIKSEFPNRPEWSDDKLYSGIANDDLSVLGEYSTGELIGKLFAANNGQKEKDYKDFVYQTLSIVNLIVPLKK